MQQQTPDTPHGMCCLCNRKAGVDYYSREVGAQPEGAPPPPVCAECAGMLPIFGGQNSLDNARSMVRMLKIKLPAAATVE